MKRRDALRLLAGSSAGLFFGSISRRTCAQIQFVQSAKMPVGYVAHGAPMLLGDKVRGPDLTRWGASIPRPTGIVVMTPHYRARGLEIGHVGEGFGMYNLPEWIKELTPNATYATPSNAKLAARVQALLGARGVVSFAKDRPGFDHTTWIPLFHMFPKADVPVVEIAMPFAKENDFFEMGRALAPLRDEGILILASGTITHNLAATDLTATSAVPAWSSDFDTWARNTLQNKDISRLLAWRKEGPRADVAHPDDGGHFRVLLFALGAASAQKQIASVKFPIEGFELGNLSKRCVELA